jgi:hypothetical protein
LTAFSEKSGDIFHKEHARVKLGNELPKREDQIVPGILVLPDSLDRETLARRPSDNEVNFFRTDSSHFPKLCGSYAC